MARGRPDGHLGPHTREESLGDASGRGTPGRALRAATDAPERLQMEDPRLKRKGRAREPEERRGAAAAAARAPPEEAAEEEENLEIPPLGGAKYFEEGTVRAGADERSKWRVQGSVQGNRWVLVSDVTPAAPGTSAGYACGEVIWVEVEGEPRWWPARVRRVPPRVPEGQLSIRFFGSGELREVEADSECMAFDEPVVGENLQNMKLSEFGKDKERHARFQAAVAEARAFRGGEGGAPSEDDAGRAGSKADGDEVVEEAEGVRLHLSDSMATGYEGVHWAAAKRFEAKAGEVSLGVFGTAVQAALCYARHQRERAAEPGTSTRPGSPEAVAQQPAMPAAAPVGKESMLPERLEDGAPTAEGEQGTPQAEAEAAEEAEAEEAEEADADADADAESVEAEVESESESALVVMEGVAVEAADEEEEAASDEVEMRDEQDEVVGVLRLERSDRSATGFKGVRRNKGGRFEAHVRLSGRSKCLGAFDTAEGAALCRARALHSQQLGEAAAEDAGGEDEMELAEGRNEGQEATEEGGAGAGAVIESQASGSSGVLEEAKGSGSAVAYARHQQTPRGAALVGKMVKVYWSGDWRWYKGTVRGYDAEKGHDILYQDGDEKYHLLDGEDEKWQLVAAKTRKRR